MSNANYRYFTRCCDGDPALGASQFIDALNAMTDRSREVTYRTLRRRCEDLRVLERRLGYDHHLRMVQDYHVRYKKSRYRGARVFYVVHSAIEHIFVHRDDLLKLQ